MFYKWGGSDILSISTLNHYSRILKFVAVILLLKNSTPPAKKTEPSNLVLRAQDHKKNPKFKGWQ